MKKINLQKLINLKKELWWELYWFLDSKMNKFYKWVGAMTICFILFLKGMVERFGWYKSAMFTPLIVLCTVLPFFTFMFLLCPSA